MNEIEKYQIECLRKNIIVTKKMKGDLIQLIAKKADKQGYYMKIETDFNTPENVLTGLKKSIKDLWI